MTATFASLARELATSALEAAGRADLVRHLVAWQDGSGRWRPTVDGATVDDARKSYDAGTHEMAQCKTASGTALVLILRRKRVLRPPRHRFSYDGADPVGRAGHVRRSKSTNQGRVWP